MRRESPSQRAAWTALIDGRAPRAAAPAHFALGRLKSGVRNKTEAAYEQHLEMRKQVGEVLWFAFEGITLKLAPDTRFTPDFAVLLASGILECHDTKGTTTLQRRSGERVKAPYFQEDAKIKMKVAASMFPLVFKVVYFADRSWIEEEV